MRHRYDPHYGKSRALVIGINAYNSVTPLGYAVSDAEGVAEALQRDLGFPGDGITLLCDKDATHSVILDAFHGFADSASDNDRLVVFFAGHGFTLPSRRGEVGFLVPVDGDPSRVASLIRMDELLRASELLPHKHVLFLLDACFSGLAFRRLAPQGGSKRFLQDMLQRHSRQAIAAGKGDETVADADGPLPEHSVFTGHLLNGLAGSAMKDGVLTANMLMAYVCHEVANDPHSVQTPHYGAMDGDGDMVLQGPDLFSADPDEKAACDLMVEVAPPAFPAEAVGRRPTALDSLKEYLSETQHRIRLDDLVTVELRRVLSLLDEESFPVSVPNFSTDDCIRRLVVYEDSTTDLLDMATLLGRWGVDAHRPLLGKLIARLCEPNGAQGGLTVLLALRWYPALLVLYSAGIGALAADSYDNLAAVLLQPTPDGHQVDVDRPAVLGIGAAVLELVRSDLFKGLAGHEQHYVPLSEYLHRLLQPRLDDLLYLGASYERLFDRLEIMFALVHVDQEEKGESLSRVWGPIGRFGWKHQSRQRERSPLRDIREEAEQAGAGWAPLQAGFFRGKLERFMEVWTAYQRTIEGLQWF
jgi:hypothetical protein